MKLRVIRLGQIEYQTALKLQLDIQQQVQNGECEDTLLLLEHPPVLTMGLRSEDKHILLDEETLKGKGIEVIKTKRGGDVTYLGPGQIIGYFICDLKRKNRDIRVFVKQIEQAFVNLLQKKFDIESTIGEKKYTGVFVGDHKITAMGFGVSRKVTMHGFAFNYETDLKNFDWIIPCGLYDKGVTSIEKLTGRHYNRTALEAWLINELAESMGYDIEIATIDADNKVTKVAM